MLAKLIESKEEQIALVENTGIQFTDYELTVDWNSGKPEVEHAVTGYFVSAGSAEPYVRLRPDDGDEAVYRNAAGREVDIADALASLPTKSSLELYDGVWFPVPFFAVGGHMHGTVGPWCWARCRVVDITARKQKEEELKAKRSGKVEKKRELTPFEALMQARQGENEGPRTYHITIAFDTKADEVSTGEVYYLPTVHDVQAGTIFELSAEQSQHSIFLKALPNGVAWVNEWAQAVFTKLAKERLDEFSGERAQDVIAKMQNEHLHEQHYLNMLAFLNLLVKPKQIKLLAGAAESTTKPVEVSLVLDIGNSRSCGILVEHYEGAEFSSDDFSGTSKLVLRDLNAPENEYDEPFVSRLEFARANFDFDGKAARSLCTEAFTWPSLVRVGTEAAHLAAMRQGSEGRTGLTSPKRYLWQSQGFEDDTWFFNNAAYQIKSQTLSDEAKRVGAIKAFARPFGSYINTWGEALFASSSDASRTNLKSGYSYRSCMTFMLSEIFLQALRQMNAASHRRTKLNYNAPRYLKTVILTVPPAMPQEERENLRSCIYEALGIIWKCLGYDTSPADVCAFASDKASFKQALPEVKMDWNEAEAGQVVYLYNETQKVFRGSCHAFVDALRQPELDDRCFNHLKDKYGHDLVSTRIATVDIGGGTTDLVIRDYTYEQGKADHESDLIPYEVVSTGGKIAGDDLLLDLIKLGPLQAIIEAISADGRFNRSILDRILGQASGNVQDSLLRVQMVDQILSKVALRILFHLEHLSHYEADTLYVTGSMADFLYGNESKDDLPPEVPLPEPAPTPNAEALQWFNAQVQEYIASFDLMQVPLKVDLIALDRKIREGNFNLSAALHNLCVLINQYEPDVLLLTGRPSQLPAIRALFEERLALSPARIVSMHSYECGSWYSFSPDGVHIGDPKTTAAMGALLSHMRSDHSNFPNFRYQSAPMPPNNQMHYVGIVMQSGRIAQKDEVFAVYDETEGPAMTFESCAYADKRGLKILAFDDSQAKTAGGRPKDINVKMAQATFNLKLAADFGYRQFADPSGEATALYRLEMIDNVEQYPELIRLKRKYYNLSIDDLTPTNIKAYLEDIEGKGIEKINTTLAPELRAILERMAQCEAIALNPPEVAATPEEQQALQAQAEMAQANAKVGLFGRLKGERTKLIAEDYAKRLQTLLTQKRAAQAKAAADELAQLKRSSVQKFYAIVKYFIEQRTASFQRVFDKAAALCNSSRADFTLTLQLKVVNTEHDHPFPYLKRELKDKLPPLVRYEIAALDFATAAGSVKGANDIKSKDLPGYFKFKLRTVLEPEYWTSSGRII